MNRSNYDSKRERSLGKRNRRTGADVAYDLLRRRILALDIPPKTDLDEVELARSCKVSRTPLREALIRLVADGLIVQAPNRGFVVSPLLLPDFPQFIEALAINQGAVCALAAVNRTDLDLKEIQGEAERFADAVERGDLVLVVAQNSTLRMRIATAGRNEYFTTSYRRLLDESVRLAHTFFIHDDRRQAWIDGYEALVKAIAHQDAEEAEQLGRHQAIAFQRQILAYLESHELNAIPTLFAQSKTAKPRQSDASRRRA